MSFKADIQATRSSDAAVATTLNEGGTLSATDTTITLTSATGFPAGGGLIMIEDEVIEYTAVSTNDLTGCTRGANGTTATTHADSTAVSLLAQIIAPPVRLKGISIASDAGGAGLVSLASNDGVIRFTGDVPSGDVYTLNIPEDGIMFPKGIYLKTSANVEAYTLFTDKYSAGTLTSDNG